MSEHSLSKTSVAFLGLGVMGFPMAGHLHTRGYAVTVYNRSADKADRWISSHTGGHVARTPAVASKTAQVVFMCVGNDNDLRSVAYGPDGVLAGLQPGAILVDHTTASAEVARELAQACANQGAHFVDAPVSGGQVGAEKGQLTIMCGGDEAAFRQVESFMMAYAKAATLMGPTGSGQLTKMVNQICIAGLLQGLAEALNFAECAQLDVTRVLDVISKGAAQSWQMDNRGRTMAQDQFDFGFAVDWMRKDLGLVIAEAKTNGALLPMTALVDQFYAEVQGLGGGRWDTSSLIRRFRQPKVMG